MRTVVIGGTGHIGSFLVPRLVHAGHQVAVMSRGERRPYIADDTWSDVAMVVCNRQEEENDGTFGPQVAALAPDAVLDLTCFTVDSARHLVEALPPSVHIVHTGSIWAYGRSLVIPVDETSRKAPFGSYGVNKARIEDYLIRGQERLRATVIHPGHITGPGWVPINPAGNLELRVFADLIDSGRAVLPERGMGLLQHVHADDVAALHLAVLSQPDRSAGEAFNSVAVQSMTLRGYAELIATEYGHQLELQLLPWSEYVARVGESVAAVTYDHIERSPHVSATKAERLLGFRHARSGWSAVSEAIDWLISDGRLAAPEVAK
ncbi:MAG: NAD-dependent epimerase/dehydratase family protein [Microbacterium sp.]|uniref:NAD-dependent epimerase/dehydratase family protein n=1 Tax=Microbacterium sp. TaxID=51671 RepID=UPI003BAEDC10